MGSLVLASPAAAQTWSPAGDIQLARAGHQATLLADGRILVTGGGTPGGTGYENPTLAEIYDPASNTSSPTAPMQHGRIGSTTTLLGDGRVLAVGGVPGAYDCAHDSTTELYDPTSGTWSFTADLPYPYWPYAHTATMLEDGRVLVAGGGDRCGTLYDQAFLYDPQTGTWTQTGSMTSRREYHAAVRLADGRVLVAGGQGQSFYSQASAEIYDPNTGTWTPTGSMATQRIGGPFLTLLSDGRVMATGGVSGYGNAMSPNGPEVEIWDPATGVWTPTDSMSVGRAGGTLSLLADGSVLAVGGTDPSYATHASTELWDPSTETWSDGAPLAHARAGHTATLLADGSVLVIGGYENETQAYLTSAERYGLEMDDTPPVITITKPADGKLYTLGSEVLADYSCHDDGSGVATCVGPVASGAPIDTGTVGSKDFTVNATDNEGNASSLTHTYAVVFDYDGFFLPVDNMPTFNSVKAGAAVPVKFSLNGDQGLDVFETGYPKSQGTSCPSGGAVDGIEETVAAGSSSLSYDAVTDQYTYVWKTQKGWANTCRQLVLELSDGMVYRANFEFK